MKKFGLLLGTASLMLVSFSAKAQYRDTAAQEPQAVEKADTVGAPVVITLEQALQIALSENLSVKVADMEIRRTEYAKKSTYSSLFPQVDLSGSYQRTIKRQVMYMDVDMSALTGGAGAGSGTGSGSGTGTGSGTGSSSGTGSGSGSGEGSASAGKSLADGMEVGRLNTLSFGVSAALPLVNAQLWESIKISGKSVDLAVEKARASRLDMITQVKNAFYTTLLAKEAFNVYKEVYENALRNYEETEKKYNAQKASDLDLNRAKTTVANAVPNVYNAESSVILALWQLKALMGVDLDTEIDVAGNLEDYSEHMFYDIHQHDSVSLDANTTMRQLAIQAEQLARNIRLQKYAYIPTLAAQFNFSVNSMANDVKVSEFRWTPYSYVGIGLSIPIITGGKRINDVRQAKNQYSQLQLQTQDTERNLRIAIRQSLNTMETNMKSYYAAQEAVGTAQKGYDIAERSYQVGRSTLIELNDAQLALTQAKLSESQAIYNFVVAKAQLEQTLGKDFVE